MGQVASSKILALDLSTYTGWAVLDAVSGNLLDYGNLVCTVEDFNVNGRPETSPLYPRNIKLAADDMGLQVYNLICSISPTVVIIENTVKGRNRHTQRILEWIHKSVFDAVGPEYKIVYLDPSQWRKELELRMSKEDKDNNVQVKKGTSRGKITPKHLSVRRVNDKFKLELKLKDNDIADAINLGDAAFSIFNKLKRGE